MTNCGLHRVLLDQKFWFDDDLPFIPKEFYFDSESQKLDIIANKISSMITLDNFKVENTLCVNRASLSYLKRAHFATLTANECWLQSYSSVTICFMPLCLVLSSAKEKLFQTFST